MSENLKVGCRVQIKNLKGTVSFVGATQFATGKWVGVTLDEELGKNDGEVQGKRYFQCAAKHGVFVRPPQVQILEQPKRRVSTLEEPSSKSLLRKKSQQHNSSSSPKTSKLASGRMKSPARTSKLPGGPAASKPSRLSMPAPSSRQQRAASGGSQSGVGRRSLAPSMLSKKPQQQEAPAVAVVEEPEEEEIFEEVEDEVMEEDPPAAQPVAASPSSYTQLAPGMSLLDFETLKAQVKDWKEKYETIRLKRQEDRTKLKEVEKMRIQMEQLNDGKNRSAKQVQELSKQLREAKKTMEEAIESKEKYMDDMTDYHDNIELATLDKEMAEEKADQLQNENELLKGEVEELKTDLEIMKAEIELAAESAGGDGGASAANNYKVKQLEEQNNKLREVIIRMKDLSTAEKSQAQATLKELEETSKQLEEVKAKKEKIAAKLEQAEALEDELKEQVDAASDAEIHVVTLTDKYLELEDKQAGLLEQINDLEALNDMNDELHENSRELELELREELDLMRSKLTGAERRTQAAQDNANDHIETIGKFRSLVKELQEQNAELRTTQLQEQEVKEPSQQQPAATAAAAKDYQIKMSETKTSTRMVDSKLSELKLEESIEEVDLVSLFIPTIFNRRGGNHDCVQTLLLLKRMMKKCEILANFIDEKYGVSETHEKGARMLGSHGNQLTFAAHCAQILWKFHYLLIQYIEVLNVCDVELFQKIGTLYSEMKPHDNILNQLFNHIKRDTLDETTNVEALSKSVQYFQHVYLVHLKRIELDCTGKMKRHCEVINVILSSVFANNARLRSFVQNGQETSDVAILLKDISTLAGDVHRLNKKAKRKLPDSIQTCLRFDEKVDDKLMFNIEHLQQVDELLRIWATSCGSLNVEPVQVPTHKLSELLRATSKQQATFKESPLEGFRIQLGSIVENLNAMVTSLQEGEFDVQKKKLKDKKIIRPVVQLSTQVKSQLADCEELVTKINERDATIVQLKKNMKIKNDDIQEAKLRSAMFEKKLTKAGEERNEKVTFLQQKLDSLTEVRKKKDKEYDETFDSMQNDIDQLECEKSDLKDRLQIAKRNVFTELGMKPLLASGGEKTPASSAADVITSQQRNHAGESHSSLLKLQLEALRVMLRRKCLENNKLLGEKMRDELRSLPSLDISHLYNKPTSVDSTSSELKSIKVEGSKLQVDAIKFAMAKVVDVSKKTKTGSPQQQVRNRRVEENKLKMKIDQILMKVNRVKQAAGKNSVASDYTTFPSQVVTQQQQRKQTTSDAKSLQHHDPELLVGRIHLSENISGITSNKLVMNVEQFNRFKSIVQCY